VLYSASHELGEIVWQKLKKIKNKNQKTKIKFQKSSKIKNQKIIKIKNVQKFLKIQKSKIQKSKIKNFLTLFF
jgi:hypothetical protein